MNKPFERLAKTLLASFALTITVTSIAHAQQGQPTQLKPVERETFNKPIKSPSDLKKEANDLKKSSDANKKTNGLQDDLATGSRCFNCGTIISITDAKKKAKPIWMTTTDPNESSNSEQAAKNAEKISERNTENVSDRSDKKLSDEFQKSANKPVSMGGTLANPNTGVTLQRKLGYETVVKMDDGTTKTIVTALQPAYNIGAKVRVIGNSLSPR
jgi:hypothetical protein